MKEWEGKKCSVCDWNPVIWVDTCETCGNFDSVQFGCGFGVRGGSACQIRLSLRGSLDCFSFAVVEIYQCQSCFRGSSAGWWNQTAEQTLSTYSLQTCYVQMYVDAFCETFVFSLSFSPRLLLQRKLAGFVCTDITVCCFRQFPRAWPFAGSKLPISLQELWQAVPFAHRHVPSQEEVRGQLRSGVLLV